MKKIKNLILKNKLWIILIAIVIALALYIYACRPVGDVVSRSYNFKVTTTRLSDGVYTTTEKNIVNYSTNTTVQGNSQDTTEKQDATIPLEETKEEEMIPYTNEAHFETTCYCLQGTTASGEPVQPETVAVDPNIIPLGTEMWIEGYGKAIARDTGGDIVGYRLDIWKESCDECMVWGRQMVLAKWL